MAFSLSQLPSRVLSLIGLSYKPGGRKGLLGQQHLHQHYPNQPRERDDKGRISTTSDLLPFVVRNFCRGGVSGTWGCAKERKQHSMVLFVFHQQDNITIQDYFKCLQKYFVLHAMVPSLDESKGLTFPFSRLAFRSASRCED
jgi:hypothetical protein